MRIVRIVTMVIGTAMATIGIASYSWRVALIILGVLLAGAVVEDVRNSPVVCSRCAKNLIEDDD